MDRSLLNRFANLFALSDTPHMKREVFNIVFNHPVGFLDTSPSSLKRYSSAAVRGYSFFQTAPINVRSAKALVERISVRPPETRLAITIGKCRESVSEEDVARDYLDAFTYCYDFADFFVLDFSDISTGAVQDLSFIKAVTDPILDARLSNDIVKPLVIKLYASLTKEELDALIDYFRMNGIDGVEVESEEMLLTIYEMSSGRFPIIATSPFHLGDSHRKLQEGAALIARVARERSEGRPVPSMGKILKKIADTTI